MMARRRLLKAFVGSFAAMASGCGMFPAKYRFKMIVEVETPSGIRRGSAIYEVEAVRHINLDTRDSGSSGKLRGEALIINFPNGKNLFALLRMASNETRDLAWMSMKVLDPKFDGNSYKSILDIKNSRMHNSPTPVGDDDFPLLITFSDIKDPSTAIKVNPDKLGESIGYGYHLNGIWIEKTDEPLRLESEKFSGLGLQEGRGLLRTRGVLSANPKLAETLGYKDFIRR